MMIAQNCFRPLTGISLFLLKLLYLSRLERRLVFVPSRGFLFFYRNMLHEQIRKAVFVPSRGFLFFYRNDSPRCADDGRRFSSPHGDFSFSMELRWKVILHLMVFVPSRGFLFFYKTWKKHWKTKNMFSSPHGDFSFSMKNLEKCISSSRSSFRPLTGISLFLFSCGHTEEIQIYGFRPLTGISLFL